MTRRQRNRLAPLLEDFYRKQPLRHRIREDPVELPRRYADPREIEAVALLSSTLAYGRVPLFKEVVEKILALAEGSPYRYLTSFAPAREALRFQVISSRFDAAGELFALMYLVSWGGRQYGSLGALFRALYREEEADLG